MAFPTIPTVAAGRVLSVLATTTGSGTVTSPDLSSLTKNAGDLLIAICIVYDGNSTNAEFSSWGGSFNEFVDQATTATMGIGCAYKVSTGSETGTFTVAVAGGAAGSDAAFFLLSIPGAHATTPPEGGAIANGTTAAADPGSFNPSGWDAEDTLWIAVGASGETGTGGSYTGIASGPSSYTDFVATGISADAIGGVEGAVAFRQLNAASEDVGTFSVDVSNGRNSALLLAIRPAPAPVTGSGTIDANAASMDGTAVTTNEAAGSLEAALATVSGDGVVLAPRTGSGALQAATASIDGEGVLLVPRTGEGALAASLATVDGAGVSIFQASGSLQAASATMDGAGLLIYFAAAGLQAGTAIMAGAGTVEGSGEPAEFLNPWYEGKTIYVLPSVDGLVAWVDYIPAKAVPGNPNRFDDNGAWAVVQVLTDVTGRVAWVDYIPVSIVPNGSPWRTTGYIPFERVN